MSALGVVIAGSVAGLAALGMGAGYIDHGSNASDTTYLTPYAGRFDVLSNAEQNKSWQFGLEYRYRDVFYGVRPTIGLNVDTEGAFYGYGGFHWDIPVVRDKLFLIPNFAVGGYSQGGGKDLGGAIEFRSGLELAYQFKNKQRVGIAFNHISNASIYDENPGAETVLVNFSFPLN